jgi:hypothetical protein
MAWRAMMKLRSRPRALVTLPSAACPECRRYVCVEFASGAGGLLVGFGPGSYRCRPPVVESGASAALSHRDDRTLVERPAKRGAPHSGFRLDRMRGSRL